MFFIVAAVTAIVGFALEGPVLNDARYIVGRGDDARVIWGGFFELITALSVIGTSVSLFPVVRKQNEGIALGYVAGRVVEGVAIIVGIMSLLTVVKLRQEFIGATGADVATLVTVGKSLVALHDWTFLSAPTLHWAPTR